MPRLTSVIRTTALARLLFFSAIIPLDFFTNAALADRVILSGTYSQNDILKSCVGAGGQFNSTPGGYSCSTDKGSVNCNKSGKCYGDCETCGSPTVAHKGGTILGVLSGTTLKAGTDIKPSQGPAPKRGPIMTRPVRYHPTAERSNSGTH